MKLAVAVKAVATIDEDFELAADGTELDPADLEFSLNEWDDFALEAALQLREQAGDGEVLVVTVGRRGVRRGAPRVPRERGRPRDPDLG